jgi:hypothetical protein
MNVREFSFVAMTLASKHTAVGLSRPLVLVRFQTQGPVNHNLAELVQHSNLIFPNLVARQVYLRNLSNLENSLSTSQLQLVLERPVRKDGSKSERSKFKGLRFPIRKTG